MQRVLETPSRRLRGESEYHIGTNPEMWVHLGEESRKANATLLETEQQLRAKISDLSADNERLR